MTTVLAIVGPRDPKLEELVARSLANNRDCRIAVLNVERARELYRIQRADRVPSVGAVGTIVQSFAMRAAEHNGKQPIHVFGTEGAIKVPDPNQFDGDTRLVAFDGTEEVLPPSPGGGVGRGAGVVDLARALSRGETEHAIRHLTEAIALDPV